MSEELKRRRLVVELGPDGSPVAARPNQTVVGPEDNYVGIDLFGNNEEYRGQTQRWLEICKKAGGAQGNWVAIMGDATQMRFGDHSVDEVVAVNFFGEPATWGKHQAIAAEVARVLKYKGLFTVVETIPPRFITLGIVRRLMKGAGLVQVSPGNETDINRIGQYSSVEDPEGAKPFIADFGFPAQDTDSSIATGVSAVPSEQTGVGDIVDGLEQIIGDLTIVRQVAEDSGHQIIDSVNQIAECAGEGAPGSSMADCQGAIGDAAVAMARGIGVLAEINGSLTEFLGGITS